VAAQQKFLELWQAEEHRTVIFVTHDLGEAIALADRVVLLGSGQVLEDFRVEIDRPRDLAAITADPRYQELHRRLRERLR
jgi:NitT/TauT family transport system ATP-binding protein